MLRCTVYGFSNPMRRRKPYTSAPQSSGPKERLQSDASVGHVFVGEPRVLAVVRAFFCDEAMRLVSALS